MCAVVGVAAVRGADEAGASAGHVAVCDGAPGVPRRAVPFAVAGGGCAPEAGVSQADWQVLALSDGRVTIRPSRAYWATRVAQGGGEGVGRGGVLLRQRAADRRRWHDQMNACAINEKTNGCMKVTSNTRSWLRTTWDQQLCCIFTCISQVSGKAPDTGRHPLASACPPFLRPLTWSTT